MSSPGVSPHLFDVFISYARWDDMRTVDGEVTRPISELKEALETHRHPDTSEQMRVITDVQDLDIGGGVKGAIRAKLRLSRALVVICSSDSVESNWVSRELGWFAKDQPDGLRLGVAVDLLPHVAFPEWFTAGQLGGDLRGAPDDHLVNWRARILAESHRIAAAVWGLPVVEMHDRWQAEALASLSMDLAGKALALLSTETDRAAVLAFQAHSASPTAEAAGALLAVGARIGRLVRRDDIRKLADVDAPAWGAEERYSAGVSSDGRVVVIVHKDGRVFAHDAEVGEERHITTLEAGLIPRPRIAISDDRRWAAVDMGSFGASGIHLISLDDGHVQRLWPPKRGAVSSFGFDPSASVLVFGDHDGRVHGFSLAEGSIRWSVRGHNTSTAGVVFSPDGEVVATIDSWVEKKGTIRLWETATGRVLRVEKINRLRGDPATVFTVDGRYCLVAGVDRYVTLVPVDPTIPTRRLFTGVVDNPVLAAGGKRRIAVAAGDRIAVWRSPDSSGPHTLHSPLSGEVVSMSFVPGQPLLVVADETGAFAVVDVVEERVLMGPIRTNGGLITAPMPADGTGELVAVHTDGTITRWDLGRSPVIGPFAQSRDGRRIVSLRNDKVRIWDEELRRLGGDFAWSDARPTGAGLSTDGSTLAVGFADRLVRLWDLDASREISVLNGAGDSLPKAPKGRWRAPTWRLEFAPNSGTLAAQASFDDQGYSMWDEVLVWKEGAGTVELVSDSPGATRGIAWLDDRHLLIGEESALAVWRVEPHLRVWSGEFEEWEAVKAISAVAGPAPLWIASHDDDRFRIYEGSAKADLRDTVQSIALPAISADCQWLAWQKGKSLVVWSVPLRKAVTPGIWTGTTYAQIEFSPVDGSLLARRGDGRVERWLVRPDSLRAKTCLLVDPDKVEQIPALAVPLASVDPG